MEIAARHIDFLRDFFNEMKRDFLFKKPFDDSSIGKKVKKLVEKKPVFVSNFLAAIYRRRPMGWELNQLRQEYPFFRIMYGRSKPLSTKKDYEALKNVMTFDDIERAAQKIYEKHFPKDEAGNNGLDLMRRLDAKQGCIFYSECNGLPDANFGIGGCEGHVFCNVYSLGGSHGMLGSDDKHGIKLRKQGYKHPGEVPDKIALPIMREIYNEKIIEAVQRGKLKFF